MKFIITESQKEKIFDVMYNYIDKIMPNNPYVEFWYTNEFGDEEDTDFLSDETTHISAYDNDELDEPLFKIYLPSYWEYVSDEDRKNELISSSPILALDYEEKNLNGLFNNMWHEPFKKWIKDNIPSLEEIDIKTFE